MRDRMLREHEHIEDNGKLADLSGVASKAVGDAGGRLTQSAGERSYLHPQVSLLATDRWKCL